MEILGWVDEEYSWEALSDREVHKFFHAVPDILELADVKWNRVPYALHVAPRYSVVGCYRDELFYANLSSNCWCLPGWSGRGESLASRQLASTAFDRRRLRLTSIRRRKYIRRARLKNPEAGFQRDDRRLLSS